MTGSIQNQTPPTSRRVLWLFVLTPVVLLAAALALSATSGALGAAGGLATFAVVIWSGLRIRHFFTYRKRLLASSDSFPADLVVSASGSVVARYLWCRYLTLQAPGDETRPNIRLWLLAGQRARRLIRVGEVRVRGPESGKGPLLLVEPQTGSTLLGYGRRFDASQPGPTRVAWEVVLHRIRALGGGTLGCIRALPLIPAALAHGVVAGARGCARAGAVVARWLGRMVRVVPALLLKTIVRMPRALAGAARVVGAALVAAALVVGVGLAAAVMWVARVVGGVPGAAVMVGRGVGRALLGAGRALLGAARGVGVGLLAVVVWVARIVGGVPRAAVVVVRAVGRAVRAVGRAVAVAVPAVGRAVAVAVRAVGRAVWVSVHGVGRIVVIVVRGGGRALVGSARTLVAWSRAIGRGIRRLPRVVRRGVVASVSFLARTPQLLWDGLVLAGRAGRALGQLPRLVVRASRSVGSAVGWFARWVRRPQVLTRYLGLPFGLLLVTLAGLGFSAQQKPSRLSTTLIVVTVLVVGLALAWLVRRWGHYRAYRRPGGDQAYDTTARVLWMHPRPGLRAVMGPGWLAVQPAGAGPDGDAKAVPSLLISLAGGQPSPRLTSGQQILLCFRNGQAQGSVVVHGAGSRVVGVSRVFGPYRLAAPDVVRQVRHVLRRDLIVYLSLNNRLIDRHRALSRTLRRGGHTVSAEVIGATRPRWYERLDGRDSVWLRLAASHSPQYVRMSLLGRQDSTALLAGETVNLYGAVDGRGSIIVVGSRRRSTLVGVGEPWTPLEQSAG